MSQTTNVSSSEPVASKADDGEKQQTRMALPESCINLTTCSPVYHLSQYGMIKHNLDCVEYFLLF